MSPPRDDGPPSDERPDGDDGAPVDGDDPSARDRDDPGRDQFSEPDGSTHHDGSTGDDSSTERGDPIDRAGDRTEPNDGRPDSRTGVTANGGATVDAPTPRRADAGEDEEEENALRTFAFDVVSSATAVLLVGVLLFAVSGVWPPMVAVESPSMTPHMQTGDLVFVMEEQRFPGDGAVAGTGVVTAQTGQATEYRKFEKAGDVIVYKPSGSGSQTPIIHRAMFWVNESENWYDKAHQQSVGRYTECGDTPSEAMPNCPAPHAGFVTKGDANGVYDQVQGLSSPVKPAWVVGTAEVRVPKLGCIRLRTEGCAMGS